ncbi:MAG: DUF4105 domain-containing protein [Verrucomicrobia bacterium]|nr:DUF4105 domain-containing protein [Verrucomicrobiota bacterium]
MPSAVRSSSTRAPGPRLFMRVTRFGLIVFVSLIAALFIAWAAGALYFDLPALALVRMIASFGWAVGAVALAAIGRLRGRILVLLGFLGITCWWLTLRPTQDADWQPQVAVLANATREGDRFTVHNIRNFEYRSATDFTPRYDTRDFELSSLRAVDLFINYWGVPFIVHPFASFDFGPQGRLCFSIEIRPRQGQEYSTLAGLYRQFTLIYVAADERDVVRLRTNYKGEDVYLYRLRFSPDEARVRFIEFINVLNKLYARPAWYNVITHSCSTAIWALHPSAQQTPWDWRILINGFLDQMLYERGLLAGDLPFEKLRAQALINKRAQKAGDAVDFSERIRDGLAGF